MRVQRSCCIKNYGQPTPGAGAAMVSTWPVCVSSAALSMPCHSRVTRNKVLRSGPPEHTRETSLVYPNRLQHLTSFAHAHAAFVWHIGIPHSPLSVQTDAIRDAVAQIRPDPTVGQTAGAFNVESGEVFAMGLRHSVILVT